MSKQKPLAQIIPPQQIEVEERVLAAALVDRRAAETVVERLQAAHFYRTAHQVIFKAIAGVIEQRAVPELTSVVSWLRDHDLLGAAGGATAIARLIEDVPAAANLDYFASLLLKASARRLIIEGAQQIISQAQDMSIDAEDLLESLQRSALEISLDNAAGEPTGAEGLMIQVMGEYDRAHENQGQLSGVPTGFAKLDDVTHGLQATDLCILAARPSMGKTSLACSIALNAADQGCPVLLFSLEMGEMPIGQKLVCIRANLDTKAFRDGHLSTRATEMAHEAADQIAGLPLWIDDRGGLTVAQITARARAEYKRKNIKLIVIDHAGLIQADGERDDLRVAAAVKGCKNIAKELKVPVLLLNQLNRKVEDRENKTPQLADLRGSGQIEETGDLIMFLYRPEHYLKQKENPPEDQLEKVKGKAKLLVRKNRMGPLEDIKLTFKNHSTGFVDR